MKKRSAHFSILHSKFEPLNSISVHVRNLPSVRTHEGVQWRIGALACPALARETGQEEEIEFRMKNEEEKRPFLILHSKFELLNSISVHVRAYRQRGTGGAPILHGTTCSPCPTRSCGARTCSPGIAPRARPTLRAAPVCRRSCTSLRRPRRAPPARRRFETRRRSRRGSARTRHRSGGE